METLPSEKKKRRSLNLADLRKKQRSSQLELELATRKAISPVIPSSDSFSSSSKPPLALSPTAFFETSTRPTFSAKLPSRKASNPFGLKQSPSSNSTTNPFAAILGVTDFLSTPAYENQGDNEKTDDDNQHDFDPVDLLLREDVNKSKSNAEEDTKPTGSSRTFSRSNSKLFALLHDKEKTASTPINTEMLQMFKENSLSEVLASAITSTDSASTPAPSTKKIKTEDKIPSADWSLKRKLVFTSTQDFSWCDSKMRSGKDMAIVVSRISWSDVQWKESQQADLSVDTIDQREFWRSLHFWIYPAHPIPQSQQQLITKLLAKDNLNSDQKRELDQWRDRYQEWKKSFQSVYCAWRNGECEYFYYISTETVVLFVNREKDKHFRAYMVKSSRGLRKILKEEGITFSYIKIPSRPATGPTPSSSFYASNEDMTPLLFEDVNEQKSKSENWSNNNIHGLYEWLLHWREGEHLQQQNSVMEPQISSGKCFLGASLRCAEVRHSVVTAENLQTMNKVEILGMPYLLPRTVESVLDIMKKRYFDDLKVILEGDENTSSFKYISY